MKSLSSLKYLAVFCALAILVGLAACSEDPDNPKYTSRPPVFSGVEVNSLDGDSTLRAGKELVVTPGKSWVSVISNNATITYN